MCIHGTRVIRTGRRQVWDALHRAPARPRPAPPAPDLQAVLLAAVAGPANALLGVLVGRRSRA